MTETPHDDQITPEVTPPVPTSGDLTIPDKQEVVVDPIKEDQAPTVVEPITAPLDDYEAVREQLVQRGVDFTEMDQLFQAGEALKDEHIKVLAEKSGFSESQVKTHMNLLQLQHRQQLGEQQAFQSELDTISGGSHQELFEFIGKSQIDNTRRAIWNASLATKQPDVVKEVFREMQVYRGAVTGGQTTSAQTTINPPNLNLLTQSNTNTSPVPSPASSAQSPQVNVEELLKDNPFKNAALGTLANLKHNPYHPSHALAMEAMRVRFPELA